MCTPAAPLSAVHPSDYEKMPSVITSSDPLFNVGKAELRAALALPHALPWVADWLFTHSATIFHPSAAALPPEAFDSALAIHLHHAISTPSTPACPRAAVSPAAAAAAAAPAQPATVSKDIDLLLVPVLNLAGVTTGYSFLKGVHEYPPATPFPASAPPPPGFIAGRFAFDNEKRDFLMVVNSMSPHMTGIVSMRWRDHLSRERSFFAIPKADYGPGNLPSRVLSVQCNVDYEVQQPTPPTFQFDQPPADVPHQPPAPPVSALMDPPDLPACSLKPDHLLFDDDPEPEERDFAFFGDADDLDDDDHVHDLHSDRDQEQVVPEMPDLPADPWAGLDALTDSWGNGLESLGTVVAPFDDPDVIPEILNDFVGNQGYIDDMDRILADPDTSDMPSNSNSSSADSVGSLQHHQQAFSPLGQKRRPEMDELALSPVTRSSSSPGDFDSFNGSSFGGDDPSWIFSTSSSSTPDGVGIPRRPGSNDTSSGSFDMSTLLGSLATIERSLKGQFYGPKVRKDILHPLTGELISRCTGIVRANIDAVDASSHSLLRTIAAQAYYSSILSVNSDNRLSITGPPGAGPFSSAQQTSSMNTRSPTDEPKRKQGRVDTRKRPAPAPLAPRPVVTIALPPGLPHPEVLQLPESSTSNPNSSSPADEQSAREAKLEAKRIKNRLSAARSNQKRRAQLEAQKKELAALRERVEELQSKQIRVAEENEDLKLKILAEI